MGTELYPGIPFSPQATITNNIGAADTIIEVSDVSAFPPAPNLATIGTDEDGETILYSAKTDTALSGCQRGIEGVAKVWRAGEVIGRNFTAKDHNDLIKSIVDVEMAAQNAKDALTIPSGGTIVPPELSGGPWELELTPEEEDVSPEAFGAAPLVHAARHAEGGDDPLNLSIDQILGLRNVLSTFAQRTQLSKQNLLRNWYFVDPVNQKGQGEYTGTWSYGIDMWTGEVSVFSDHIRVNGVMRQKAEDHNHIKGG